MIFRLFWILFLLTVSACGVAIAGDAQSDCEAFAASLTGAGDRCGVPLTTSLDCGSAVTFSLTSDETGDCRAWVDTQPCAVLENVASWPAICYPVAFAF